MFVTICKAIPGYILDSTSKASNKNLFGIPAGIPAKISQRTCRELLGQIFKPISVGLLNNI